MTNCWTRRWLMICFSVDCNQWCRLLLYWAYIIITEWKEKLIKIQNRSVVVKTSSTWKYSLFTPPILNSWRNRKYIFDVHQNSTEKRLCIFVLFGTIQYVLRVFERYAKSVRRIKFSEIAVRFSFLNSPFFSTMNV